MPSTSSKINYISRPICTAAAAAAAAAPVSLAAAQFLCPESVATYRSTFTIIVACTVLDSNQSQGVRGDTKSEYLAEIIIVSEKEELKHDLNEL